MASRASSINGYHDDGFMTTAPFLACLWALGAPTVTVESDAACPAADEVAARVTALLPARETSEPPDLARIADRGDAWVVALARPDGTPVGERALDRQVACEDLASAAAVIIATWESDVHPELRALPAPLPAPEPPAAIEARPAPPPMRAAGEADVGAALAGSLAPSASRAAPAVGVLAIASWFPHARGLGARASLAFPAARTLPLGAGQVEWRRSAASAGPTLRLPLATKWAADLHADALAGWVTAAGSGFASNHTVSALDVGLSAGARLLWVGGRAIVPWLELGGAAWLRPQTAYATPGAMAVGLPRLELGLALGLSLRVGP
jgi:hypothetical protein